MAKKLLDYYDVVYARDIASRFKEVRSDFDEKAFVMYIEKHLGNEKFLERQDIYVDALERYLDEDYRANLRIFEAIWGEELETETGMFKVGWWLWPIGRYVERHALEDVEASMRFIKEFTKRQTGEYAIRPILIEHTERTMHKMLEWSRDENVHVRRLSSEGLRLYLPWTKRTTVALEYIELFTQILTNLKDDPSKFIQKSIGNNLNDLYKYDPALADGIISKWEDEGLSDSAKWIIKYGRRNQWEK